MKVADAAVPAVQELISTDVPLKRLRGGTNR